MILRRRRMRRWLEDEVFKDRYPCPYRQCYHLDNEERMYECELKNLIGEAPPPFRFTRSAYELCERCKVPRFVTPEGELDLEDLHNALVDPLERLRMGVD